MRQRTSQRQKNWMVSILYCLYLIMERCPIQQMGMPRQTMLTDCRKVLMMARISLLRLLPHRLRRFPIRRLILGGPQQNC
ncbi:hypothetical protein THIOM_004987 [Candidatus Thiomargarita nelsonii]|uniref:Uncharacterized protein n=1 Tax=Candidatus Thiomargarita nelsonii TaxID=1003181 RepID=A0A176RUH0_9GAMM|nr:hypothetical protein THIOM_004987 [Candidatus Thiomargarita nelsonii]